MKRFICLTLILCFCLNFSGCAEEEEKVAKIGSFLIYGYTLDEICDIEFGRYQVDLLTKVGYSYVKTTAELYVCFFADENGEKLSTNQRLFFLSSNVLKKLYGYDHYDIFDLTPSIEEYMKERDKKDG